MPIDVELDADNRLDVQLMEKRTTKKKKPTTVKRQI
jgi:hypothetical protein